MRFRATLAFSFLVFVVALLASVGAKETYPVEIHGPKNDDTWVAGSTVWLRQDGLHSGENDAFLGIFNSILLCQSGKPKLPRRGWEETATSSTRRQTLGKARADLPLD
ncbi:hypothetical protein BC826DRAFT_970179 [Russula brevipes]|nr:hypothetical protein BC826DRAFT_970179 [Russula brevipes]